MKTYIFKFLIVVFMLVLLPPARVSAENTQGLRVDGEGKVTLPSLEAAEEGMSSLSFSFFIDAPDAGDILFEFDGNDARIQEFRYDKETNKLNIYIAGTETAIPENGEPMEIGRIVVLDSNGNDKGTGATVHVAAGSLKYVCGTELKWMKDLETSEEMHMVSAGIAPSPTPAVPTPTPAAPSPTPEIPTPTPAAPSPTPEVPTPTPTSPGSTPAIPTSTPGVPSPTPLMPTPTPEAPASSSNPDTDPGSQSGSEYQPETSAQPTQNPGQPGQTPLPGQTSRPASTDTPGQTAGPAPDTSPSATPQIPGSQEAEEDPDDEDEGVITLPAVNDSSDKDDHNNGSSSDNIDWVMAAAVIAMVLFVIVAVMAIVVLKGGPGRTGHWDDDDLY